MGDIPRWTQSHGGSILFVGHLPQCSPAVYPVPKRVPDRMLNLFAVKKDYSFLPIPLQVSRVPSSSAFRTASGTASALTAGGAQSPWWGKAS